MKQTNQLSYDVNHNITNLDFKQNSIWKLDKKIKVWDCKKLQSHEALQVTYSYKKNGASIDLNVCLLQNMHIRHRNI